MSRRVTAAAALACFAGTLVLLVLTMLQSFPRGLVFVALLVGALLAAWEALFRKGRPRVTLWAVAGILVAGMVVMVVDGGLHLTGVGSVVLLVATILLARYAFRVHVHLPAAPPPQRAVVVYNVKSGGGKAVSNNLAEEARRRGITPRELLPGEDWEQVVRDLVAGGADGLAAAGGDGTQALVATVAAEHDLPFACIPAGTRNHFALDLGVDRDDVVGALDAFVTGGEKRVDLGDVAGRTFVNNVSLGAYADAVQHEGYREAKLRTLLQSATETLASGDRQLRWRGPDGAEHRSAAVVLVSNNAYRLGRAIGSGTRPRIDAGLLGVAAMGATSADGSRRRGLLQWTQPEFVVESDGPIPVGVDGEALVLPSPLVFRSRPGVLRVRIAPQHPGASPSAGAPSGLADAVTSLWRIATTGS